MHTSVHAVLVRFSVFVKSTSCSCNLHLIHVLQLSMQSVLHFHLSFVTLPLDDVPGPSWWTPPPPVARRHSRQWGEEGSRPAKQNRGTQSVLCAANCHTSHCHSLSLLTTLHHPVHHCVLSHTILVWSTQHLHGLFHLLYCCRRFPVLVFIATNLLIYVFFPLL